MTEEELEAVNYFKEEIENFKKAQENADKEIDDRDWFKKLWCELQNDIDKRTIILNLLEKKDKRISDLEYALIDMVMQFADRPKIKDCHYALSTMGLSALETAFAELDFDDPMPVAEAEKKYKVLVDKYFEMKVEEDK